MSVPHPTGDAAPHLIAWLRALRARARALLLTYRIALILAVFLAAALAGGILDFLARFPAPIRIGAWSVAALSLALAVWKLILPALRLQPALTDIALRVEQARPDLKGLLAAAVDFESASRSSGGAGFQPVSSSPPLSLALQRLVVSRAVNTWNASTASAPITDARPAVRALAWCAASLILALAPALISTTLWSIGAQRILTPWTGASWPKRTAVADVTNLTIHPLGSALPLRAELTKWNGPLDNADVTVRYCTRGADGPGASSEWRRELLTLQDSASHPTQQAPVFERLIEPSGAAVEYRFETADDATDWTTITLVEPPRVEEASATITPPAYAELLPTTAELGAGLDERALAPPMLAGSRISLSITLNKPARLARDATIASLLGDAATVESHSTSGNTITAEFTVRAPIRLPITLVDEHGIESVEAPVFVFGALADNPPAAAITDPSADVRVAPSALIELLGEGRDDVGLDAVALTYQRHAPQARSQPGGATEPVGPENELARETVAGEARTTLTARASLDLAALGVTPGEEIHAFAIAHDRYEPTGAILGADSRTTEPTRSLARIISVISEEALLDEIREALTEMRQAAIRIESTQRAAGAGSPKPRTATADARRAQSEATDRLARQRDALQRIADRAELNRLDDTGLSDILQEAADTIDRAAESSAQAAAGLERTATQAPANEAAPVDEPTAKAQDRALEETRRLIELLDRGEDTWVVESRLRQIAEGQQNLQNRAADIARETAGRTADQLSPQEQQDVAELARDQEQLADEFARLLEEMRRREEALRDADPDAAAGMQAAAERARRDQTEQTMREAAQQAEQNQMANAGEQQSRAAQSLQQMMQDMQAGSQQRDERLRRMLRDLIASIESLIQEQTAAIAELQAATENRRAADGLDQAMITLNRNTASVADLARAGGPEMGVAASLLEDAAQAQTDAIPALRADSLDLDAAALHENRSLSLLREARRAAEQEQQRQAEKEIEEKKQKLRAKYRAILEKQLAVRDQTEEFRNINDLDRRDRIRLRRLADPQREVTDALAAMLTELPELLEAKVFQHAHARLDETSSRAADSLEAAEAARAAARQDAVIAILQGLVRALDESTPDEQKFAENQSGSAGSGGGGGSPKDPLVSAMQELSLLRSIQTVVANETALADNEQSPEARQAMLRDLATQQRELADVAGELLTRLGKNNPTDILPRPEPPAEPPTDPDSENSQPDPSEPEQEEASETPPPPPPSEGAP